MGPIKNFFFHYSSQKIRSLLSFKLDCQVFANVGKDNQHKTKLYLELIPSEIY